MIGQIIGAVGGLASSYLDGKVAVQKANAEIKLSKLQVRLTGTLLQ
jgi:hypothetical protein